MNKDKLIVSKVLSRIPFSTRYQYYLSQEHTEIEKRKPRTEHKIHKGKMPLVNLIDVIVALLHHVTGPRHRQCGHHGGRRQRRPTSALPPLAFAPSNPRVLERPPSPSPDRPAGVPTDDGALGP
jgi:hypothetical protein